MSVSTDPPAPDPTTPDGLAPGQRYRCDACGNVTRFDVEVRSHTRRFVHLDLAGTGVVEEEEILTQEVLSVACRWCGSDRSVRVEPAPGARPPSP